MAIPSILYKVALMFKVIVTCCLSQGYQREGRSAPFLQLFLLDVLFEFLKVAHGS